VEDVFELTSIPVPLMDTFCTSSPVGFAYEAELIPPHIAAAMAAVVIAFAEMKDGFLSILTFLFLPSRMKWLRGILVGLDC